VFYSSSAQRRDGAARAIRRSVCFRESKIGTTMLKTIGPPAPRVDVPAPAPSHDAAAAGEV
jgi:hypothetical protein